MESRNLRGMGRQSPQGAKEEMSAIELFRALLIGLASSVISALILLAAGAGIAYGGDDPSSLELPLALAALYISMFIGGMVTAKLSGSVRLLGGLLFAVVSVLSVFILGLFMADGEAINGSYLYLGGIAASSIVGAFSSALITGRKRMVKRKKAGRFGKKK